MSQIVESDMRREIVEIYFLQTRVDKTSRKDGVSFFNALVVGLWNCKNVKGPLIYYRMHI